ncbi:MAG: hypothetical protein AABX10_03065 [Nanoarchaeota archaeon]
MRGPCSIHFAHPDGHNWMAVYTPERSDINRPELRADIKFFTKPSQFGIKKGKISKLGIYARTDDIIAKVMGMPSEKVTHFFNYDRGADLDELDRNPQAKRLYDIVVRELN